MSQTLSQPELVVRQQLARRRSKILLNCTSCGAELAAPSRIAGKTGICPHCLSRFSITPAAVQPKVAAPTKPDRHNQKASPKRRDVQAAASPAARRSRLVPFALAVLSGISLCAVAALALTLPGDTDLPITLLPLDSEKQPVAVQPDAEAPVESGGADLASRAGAILQQRCYACHGEAGKAEGGFNFVLSPEKLVDGESYIAPGAPESSYLFERIVTGEMPPPGEADPLSTDEIETLREWITAGAPSFAASDERRFIRFADMFATMKRDLEETAERSRQFIRYFSLTHLHNAGDSEDELETYRLALVKLMNSLSRSKELVYPETIDVEKTIFKIDLRDLDWTSDIWGKLVEASPYAITFEFPDAESVYELTGSDAPLLRADWFVAAASKPPLYHEILEIPETLDELLEDLRVDVERNKNEDRVLRVGFNRSGVSQNNRMIERHDLPAGGYIWISYDFAGNIGRQNLFAHPLGPGEDERLFTHDGGEIIFSLPNGMQAYMLVDGQGNRINEGPTNIVSDPRRPDRTVLNGISCISCHYAGIIQKADEIRSHVLQNRNAFADDLDEILAQYQAQDRVQQQQRDDARRFQQSLGAMGIERITQSNEPVFNIAARFDGELDANLAAAELGMTPDELTGYLQESPEIARALGIVTSPGGVIKRDAYVSIFHDAAEQFGVARAQPAKPAGQLLALADQAAPAEPADDPQPQPANEPAASNAAAADPAAVEQAPAEAANSTAAEPATGSANQSAADPQRSVNPAADAASGVAQSATSQPVGNQPRANQPVASPPAANANADLQTADFRIFRNVTGEHRVEARLVSVSPSIANPVVRLQLRDGRTIDVRCDQLSAADQRFIRDRQTNLSPELDSQHGCRDWQEPGLGPYYGW